MNQQATAPIAAPCNAQPSPVLERWLQKNKIAYDWSQKMLVEQVEAKPGDFHDGARARGGALHPTRESLGLAVRLIQTDEPDLIAEGQAKHATKNQLIFTHAIYRHRFSFATQS